MHWTTTLIAGFSACCLLAAPVAAQSANAERRTEIVNLEGEAVDSLLLRYKFDALWALDARNLVLRDSFRDHYLVTFDAPCAWLENQRSIRFVPALSGRIRSTLPYEARDVQGPVCEIVRIREVASRDAAQALIAG